MTRPAVTDTLSEASVKKGRGSETGPGSPEALRVREDDFELRAVSTDASCALAVFAHARR